MRAKSNSPSPAQRQVQAGAPKAISYQCNFALTVSNTGATLASPMIYAAIHQFGGTIRGNPWLRFQWAPGKWATVASVTISPRPFFPVLNGRLTPKAEEKIRATGQRAIERQFKS